MQEDYKRAMSRITADESFKAELLKKLKQEQENPAPKLRQLKRPLRVPIVASLSSAAVLALLIYSSTVFLLPMLRNSEYDMSAARPGSDYVKSERPSASITDERSENHGGIAYGDSLTKERPQRSDKASTDNKNGNDGTTDSSDKLGTDSANSGDNSSSLNDINPHEDYKIISYAGKKKNVGSSPSAKTISYDNILHFTFEGFDMYGIGLKRNDIVFSAELGESYTLADLFIDYYSAIIGRDAKTSVTDGMLDSFFGIESNSEHQINVFIDGTEAVNLNNVPVSELMKTKDVYFTISVT